MPGEAPDRRDRVATDSIGRDAPPMFNQNVKQRVVEEVRGPMFGMKESPSRERPIIVKEKVTTAVIPAQEQIVSPPIAITREAPALKHPPERAPIPPPSEQFESTEASERDVKAEFFRRLRMRQTNVRTFWQNWVLAPGQRIMAWFRAHPYITLGLFLSLLLLPLLSALLMNRAATGFSILRPMSWFAGRSRAGPAEHDIHIRVKAPAATVERKAEVHHHHHHAETHGKHHHVEEKSKLGSIADLAGVGLKAKHAAENLADVAKDTIGSVKDKLEDTWDSAKEAIGAAGLSGAHAANKAWDKVTEKVTETVSDVADAIPSKVGILDRTKNLAENIVDRVMHPMGHKEHVDAGAKTVGKTETVHHGRGGVKVEVKVKDETASSRFGFFGLRNWLASRFGFGKMFSFLGLTPLNGLMLLGLLAVPAYMLFMRRRAIRPAVRPQVVPVVRPVGYTVVGGANANSNFPAAGQQQNFGVAM